MIKKCILTTLLVIASGIINICSVILAFGVHWAFAIGVLVAMGLYTKACCIDVDD